VWHDHRAQSIGIRQIHAFLGKQWSRDLIENTLSVIRQEEDTERKRVEAYEAAQRAREEQERRQAAEAVHLKAPVRYVNRGAQDQGSRLAPRGR